MTIVNNKNNFFFVFGFADILYQIFFNRLMTIKMNEVLNELTYFDKTVSNWKPLSICQIPDILFFIIMSGILRYSHFLIGILN